MGEILEAHIVEELSNWKQYRDYENDLYEGDKYNYPYFEFPPNSSISVGLSKMFEIHVGNRTEVYFEERRFKPVKAIVVAYPNLTKESCFKGSPHYVDFNTDVLYQAPDGLIYSDGEIMTSNEAEESVIVKLPFDYKIRDMMTTGKATKLLKRNSKVLEEINGRLSELQKMKDFLEGKLD
ncbi:MAG: hypothetical protein ABIB43_05125 [archaeon]